MSNGSIHLDKKELIRYINNSKGNLTSKKQNPNAVEIINGHEFKVSDLGAVILLEHEHDIFVFNAHPAKYSFKITGYDASYVYDKISITPGKTKELIIEGFPGKTVELFARNVYGLLIKRASDLSANSHSNLMVPNTKAIIGNLLNKELYYNK